MNDKIVYIIFLTFPFILFLNSRMMTIMLLLGSGGAAGNVRETARGLWSDCVLLDHFSFLLFSPFSSHRPLECFPYEIEAFAVG
jgi:hypothetical protein